jgi:hypothetical protein
MDLTGSQRCIYCGRFLFNVAAELPFEIVSTGAFVLKLDVDINCGHCHRSHVYSIEPTKAIRIDR